MLVCKCFDDGGFESIGVTRRLSHPAKRLEILGNRGAQRVKHNSSREVVGSSRRGIKIGFGLMKKKSRRRLTTVVYQRRSGGEDAVPA